MGTVPGGEAPPAILQPRVQAGHRRGLRPPGRARGQRRPPAPGGPVLLPHRRVAPGTRRRRPQRPGRPGPQAQAQRRGGRAGPPPPPERAPRRRARSHQGGPGHHGKSTRALGVALRERGLRAQVDAVIDAAFAELAPLVRTRRACGLLGKSSATHYRRLRPRSTAPSSPRPTPPNALSAAERQAVLDALHRPEHADLPPAQVWARLLDDGTYLASISTMYRLLRERGEARDRRRARTHPARSKPELVATK